MREVEITWQRIHQKLSGSRRTFEADLDKTEELQQQVLLTILKNNEQTPFGKKYKFSEVKNVDDFKKHVPVHQYQDCQPYLEALACQPRSIDERNQQFSSETDIVCFEQTGGSKQGTKLIPYTKSSLVSFQEALLPWFDDLLECRPNIKKGTAYWSISPVTREIKTTMGGHPIGLANDALYFGESLAYDISQTLAVSPEVAMLNTVSDWYFQTLLELLLAEDLSFISVWSPTFLLNLINDLPLILDSLLDDIEEIDFSRALNLRTIFKMSQNKAGEQFINTEEIWPQLDTISCWTDGSAGSYISELKVMFPHVYIQGKGLLATEGVITIPLNKAQSPVLAVKSCFYEFIDDDGDFYLAHQLKIGQYYSVLITNNSCLYRYQLGDKVRMDGLHHGAPMLRFMGRGAHMSDLCGEKLSEDFILDVFDQFSKQSLDLGSIRFLYPDSSLPKPHYVLVTDAFKSDIQYQQLDKILGTNPQYQYARDIGQLGPLQHCPIENIGGYYIQWRMQQGQSLGDIKPPALITDANFINELKIIS